MLFGRPDAAGFVSGGQVDTLPESGGQIGEAMKDDSLGEYGVRAAELVHRSVGKAEGGAESEA